MSLAFTSLELAEDTGINALDDGAFRFYMHLHDQVDSYGRHRAEIPILKSRLFPLRRQTRDTDIARQLAACEKAGMVRCYCAFSGRDRTTGDRYVEILNYENRKNPKWKKSKHPPPEGQMPLLGQESSRVESSRVSNARAQAGAKENPLPEAAIPTWQEVLEFARLRGVPETSAKSFFDYHEDNNYWINKHDRMIEWRKKIITWSVNDRQPNHKNAKHHAGAPDRNEGTFNAIGADQPVSKKFRRANGDAVIR